jgi:asparagine synthase (glutamine-hydrolysing)
VRFARALVAKILSRPAAEISTKENQTFMFLMSLALLHRQFISHERLTPAAPARMTFADCRSGVRAGHASQGSFISVT